MADYSHQLTQVFTNNWASLFKERHFDIEVKKTAAILETYTIGQFGFRDDRVPRAVKQTAESRELRVRLVRGDLGKEIEIL